MANDNNSDGTISDDHDFMKNKGKSKARWRVLALVVLVAIGTGGWYAWQNKEQVEESQPLLSTVSVGSIENTISAAGSLKPSNYVDVGAQVSGQLQKLHVEVGDVVEAGQLLAEIDARVQESRVDASRASIEALEAQITAREAAVRLARANAVRQEKLMADNASSQLEFDSAINSLASAESSVIQLQKQIEQNRASLLTDETQLEFTKIYAPLTGTVVSIEMNEGRTLNATQQSPTILRIADLSLMTVETEISEADIGNIKKGMRVYFTTLGGGNRRWHSELRQILPTPTVTNNVVLYTGLFDIDNSDASLLPEMTTQVYFVTSSVQNVLKVPMGALSFIDKPGGAGAMMGGEDGRPDPARLQEMMASGEIPEEVRERFRQMRESGNLPQGDGAGTGFGNGNTPGAGFGRSRLTSPGERSLANVTVVKPDGTREVREVVVGLTSRVDAEVISGLQAGEEVIAGIAQTFSANPESGNNNFRPPAFMFR